MPLMRHNLLEFPLDLKSHEQAYDYSFGHDLLISPV